MLFRSYSVGEGIPSRWRATRGAHTVLALFNWTDHGVVYEIGPEFEVGAELWTGATCGGAVEVPAGAVRVLVTPDP